MLFIFDTFASTLLLALDPQGSLPLVAELFDQKFHELTEFLNPSIAWASFSSGALMLFLSQTSIASSTRFGST